MENFIRSLPKAELHVHIEGTLEPELMFMIAERNNISIPYDSVEDLKKAYQFDCLQDFLNLYYAGTKVLQNEQDFYDLTWGYLEKASQQNVCHTEIFFDPQAHTRRGVGFDTVIQGIWRALIDAKNKLGISSKLIMCFLRDLGEQEAFTILEQALPFKQQIAAVGLDSAEVGYPPSLFKDVFAKARKENFLTVAHAGEEGSSEYIWEALRILKVCRVDHGNKAIDDILLLNHLASEKIPLTMCPLSNYRLKVQPNLAQHPLKRMLDAGVLVTVNSDDPAYFGGYINENYFAIQQALNLNKSDIIKLAQNSIIGSFMDNHNKERLIEKIRVLT